MRLINQLRILSWIEGCTYLAFGLTMPLKYIYGMKEPNYYVGMAHGIFFMAYIVWVFIVGFQQKYSFLKIAIFCFASLIPIGTFWIDAKYLKKEAQNLQS
jgi:integral membrane protein